MWVDVRSPASVRSTPSPFHVRPGLSLKPHFRPIWHILPFLEHTPDQIDLVLTRSSVTLDFFIQVVAT